MKKSFAAVALFVSLFAIGTFAFPTPWTNVVASTIFESSMSGAIESIFGRPAVAFEQDQTLTAVPLMAGTTSLTVLGSAYTQDFNTLVTAGASSIVPNGWHFFEGGPGGNLNYTGGTGSSNTGDTYSFGIAATNPLTDRAFGGLQSANVIPFVGASFANDTGSTIGSLNISYVGEQWRLGLAARTDKIDFQYSTNATDLETGDWTDVDSLDFTAPVTTGATGTRDGNLAANRTAISNSISGLNIAPGATFWIRWSDFNASGADDGLGVDDFSLTPLGDTTPPTAPVITTSDPISPSNDLTPNLVGTAEAGSTVNIYKSPTCAGAPVATGTAAAFASPGLEVTADASATTSFTARATDAASNVSDCSAAFQYIHTAGTEPTVQASNVGFVQTATSVTVNWTNGNGARRVVFAKQGSAITSHPVDGTTYTPNSEFGLGTPSIDGAFPVYSDTGSSVVVTGLVPGQTYHFAVYEYNGAGATTDYLTPGAAGSVTKAVVQYRSKANGTWNSEGTWEVSTDGNIWDNAVETPSSVDGTITILHNVSVDDARPVDQLTVNSGASLTVESGGVQVVNGAGDDLVNNGTISLSGSGTLDLSNSQFVNSGTFQCQFDTTLNVNAATLTNNTAINMAGGRLVVYSNSLINGAGTYSYDSDGTLEFQVVSGTLPVNNVVYWPVTNGPGRLRVFGPGNVSVNAPRTVADLNLFTGLSNAGNLTITNIGSIFTGGFFSGSPIWDPLSTLRYETGGTYGRAGEWLPNATSGGGYPHHVTIAGNTTLDLPNSSTTQPFQLAGDLTIEAGSALSMAGASPLTAPLRVLGSLTNEGDVTLSTASGGDLFVGLDWFSLGSFVNNGRRVTLNGSGDQFVVSDTTFFDLDVVGSTPRTVFFFEGTTQTVTNSLTMTGTAGNLLTLSSLTEGVQWNISAPATQSVSFVNVRDSNNTGSIITPASSINSGNNIGWNFIVTTPEIDVTPPSLAFGNQEIGVASTPQQVTIQNTGTADLNLGSITTGSATYTIQNSPANTIIAPGGQAQFTVTFTPIDSSTVNTNLTIISDDSDEPSVDVPLSGTGATGRYRSAATGLWADASTWEVSVDGGTAWNPAAGSPASDDDTITIRSGHVVTTTSAIAPNVDQLTIDSGGTLTQFSGLVTVVNGPGNDLVNNGTLNVTIGELAINGQLVNNSTASINDIVRLNEGGTAGGAGTYTWNPFAQLHFENVSAPYIVDSSATFWPALSGPQDIRVNGAGGVQMAVARTVTFISIGAGVTGAGNLTITDLASINAGGFVTGSPTYSSGSSLAYNIGGPYNRGDEWLPGATSGAGVPNNVGVGGLTELNLPNGTTNQEFLMLGDLNIGPDGILSMGAMTAALRVRGDVTISGGTFEASSTNPGDLYVGGDWINAGTLNNNERLVEFDGTGTQAISGSTDFGQLAFRTTTPRTITFEAGSVQQAVNSLTFTGTAGNLLTLRSSSNGTQWGLAAPLSQNVNFVDVRDSNAIFGFTVSASNSVNSLNNVNWSFVVPNQPPVINTTAPTTATEDVAYVYDANVTDPDGPGATWSLLGTHTCGGSINPSTGEFAFTPVGPTPPASCVVAIRVDDGGTPNLFATQSTTVNITDLPEDGNAPVVSYTPLSNIPVVSDQTLIVTAIDDVAVTNVSIHWENNGGQSGFVTNVCPRIGVTDTFTCVIDSGVGPHENGDAISYYVFASDAAGNEAANPVGALPLAGPRNMYTVGSGGTIDVSILNTFGEIEVGPDFTFNGDATVTGTLAMDGMLDTGASTLTLGCDTAIVGASGTGYIVGTVEKAFCSTGSFTFPVGTAADGSFASVKDTEGSLPEYSPFVADVTSATPGSSLTVTAIDGLMSGVSSSHAATRWWQVTESGDITANISYTYLDQDVTGNEAAFKVLRSTTVTTVYPGGSVDTGTNTASAPAVTEFSGWSAGLLAPTASNASIGGRVTNAGGRGLASVSVTVRDMNGERVGTALSSSFGYFSFEGLPTGASYIVTVRSKRYLFSNPSRIISLSEDLGGVDFVAEP